MPSFRQLATIVTSGLLGSALLAAPAASAEEPATLVVDGTLRAVVVDSFDTKAAGGADGHATTLYSVETFDGARIPVDVAGEPAPNSRFRGKVVLDGGLGRELERRGVLPDEGESISGETRAGRIAAAVAADETAPIDVEDVRLTAPAASAAAAVPASHRAYVAVVTNRGSVQETDMQINTAIDRMLQYWVTESTGVITSFARQSTRRYTSTAAGTTAANCGMQTDPEALWAEAAGQFPGVSFTPASRNHLIVALADECATGAAGVAEVGSGLDDGGRMTITLGSIANQVGVHELGHVFGLGHANLRGCSTSTTCTTDEYFDLYSPMALAVSSATAFDSPALDTAFRRRLAVAPQSEAPVVAASDGFSQTITLQPRGAATGTRGAELVDPSSGARYFVEYRSGTLRDQGTFYGQGFNLSSSTYRYPRGVTVTTIDGVADLQLTTRRTSTTYEGAFLAGQTFTAPGGRVAARVVSLGSVADLEVTFSGGFAPSSVALGGTAKVGRSVQAGKTGWPAGTSLTYQWLRNGVPIRGATWSGYTIPATMKGAALRVRVTGTLSGRGQAAVLSPSRTVASGTLVSAKPRITGTAKVGRRLRVKVGSWSPKPSFSYRWYANGKTISGATKTSYKIAKKYKGKRITIKVTGRKTGYTTVTRTSSTTKKVKKK